MDAVIFPRFMKCIPLLALFLGAPTAHSQTLDWGNSVFDYVQDSDGQRLTNAFVFELGAFDAGFAPNQSNVTEWVDHWNVFDRATYNEEYGYFASSVQMTPDGGSNSAWLTPGFGSFEGLEAYLFIRNGDLPVPFAEWLLARSSTWIFPTADPSCCPNGLPEQWSVSDINDGIPPWGAQDGMEGGGVVNNPMSDGLQTHTFVPEPAVFLLLALGGLVSVTRRRRF
jgi:hypothetical protein